MRIATVRVVGDPLESHTRRFSTTLDRPWPPRRRAPTPSPRATRPTKEDKAHTTMTRWCPCHLQAGFPLARTTTWMSKGQRGAGGARASSSPAVRDATPHLPHNVASPLPCRGVCAACGDEDAGTDQAPEANEVPHRSVHHAWPERTSNRSGQWSGDRRGHI